MAEAMIARVWRMHDRVAGTTPSGEAYCANDPELLNWVQGTAAYGFLQAYHAYVRPLSLSERDCYYAEGIAAAALYGATGAPRSEADLEMLFQAAIGRLERSDIVFEFLAIMRSTPILPLPLRPFQHLLVRAAIDLTPRWLRTTLRLNELGLHAWEAEVVRQAVTFVDRMFWKPTQPFRLAGACGFQLIICIPTNSAQEAIHQRGWQGPERSEPSPATECGQRP